MAEKILAKKAGRKRVEPGEIVEAEVDLAMVHDLTGPLTVEVFEKIGAERVWDPNKIVVVFDHQVPADSTRSAELQKKMRRFVADQGIKHFFDVGRGGICHQVLPESGLVRPGMLVVGADSHTCTYGALGAFSTGIGATDMAYVFATGKLWFKVPSTTRVEVVGELPRGVYAKDVILAVAGEIGSDGANYMAIEFCGEVVKRFSVDERLTLCNMAVELGAKTGLVEPDEKTASYLGANPSSMGEVVRSDEDAEYADQRVLDANGLEPMVACPHSVDNVKPVSEVVGTPIDQAFIGSCTNGRIPDLREAARILRERTVSDGVRLVVIPASQRVYEQAVREGLVEVFVKAGAVVCPPTCGPCLGGHMGVLASGERCISSSNRNFVGRMGSRESKVFLASPATVAASAVAGEIADPRDFLGD